MVTKGVSKAGPIVSLAFVVLMMFLPMFQLDCGVMTFDWTGVDLVTGSAGPLEDAGEAFSQGLGGAGLDALGETAEEGGEAASEQLPKDWLVLALPGLAVLGILAVLADARGASILIIVLLLGAFTYFTVVGFELEKMFDAQIAADIANAPDDGLGGEMLGPMGDVEIGTKKAGPYWMGFGAAGLALVLLLSGSRSVRD